MTEKLMDMSPSSKEASAQPSTEELETARELVRQARSRGVALTGPDGLLKALTKTVIETALDEEMSEHLGYDKHEPVGRNRGGARVRRIPRHPLQRASFPVGRRWPSPTNARSCLMRARLLTAHSLGVRIVNRSCHPVTRWISPIAHQAHLRRRRAQVEVPAGRARPRGSSVPAS